MRLPSTVLQPWQAEPFRLWSLLDMRQFFLRPFVDNVEFLFTLRNQMFKDDPLPIDDNRASYLKSSLDAMKADADMLGFRSVSSEIAHVLQVISLRPVTPLVGHKATALIDSIRRRVQEALQEGVFMYIPPDRARYHSGAHDVKTSWRKREIDPQILGAFPSSAQDFFAGFDCYAVGQPTACVFHMMRASEHGLRALVVSVGVTAPKVPLEYQQWQNYLEQIDSRVERAEIGKWPQPSRSNAHAFFSSVVSDFYAFKDDIRNILMHTRSGGTYDEPQALHVIERVTRCLVRLSSQVREGATDVILDPARFA